MIIKKLRHHLCATAALLMLITGVSAQASTAPTVTLIIDDIGYNLRNGLRAVNLPGAVNFAVLPHTPYSQRLARTAHEKGKTVMLHAPMSNIHQRNPGPGTLSPAMDRPHFESELNKALADIPFVQGVNNHMGSELTQDKTRMQWLMDEVSKRRLFFIDSRTTAKSVAAETARENGIPSMSRDIFLDHIRSPEAVSEAFDSLIRKAKRNGHAVAIGHPHRVTLDVLENRLPELKAAGIRLISVQEQLVAMGQVYPDRAPAFATPTPDLTPPRSPALWRHGIQSLSHYKDSEIRHPKIIRRQSESSAAGTPDAGSPAAGTPAAPKTPGILQRRTPVSEAGKRQPKDASESLDMTRQPGHTPDWLTPVNENPWGDPVRP